MRARRPQAWIALAFGHRGVPGRTLGIRWARIHLRTFGTRRPRSQRPTHSPARIA